MHYFHGILNILTVLEQFFLLEAADLEIYPETAESNDESSLYDALLADFSTLPKSPKMMDYAVVNVAPALVPNPYLPTFRIFTYNVTDTGKDLSDDIQKKKKKKKGSKRKHGGHHHTGGSGNKTVVCKSPEYQDTWRCHLRSDDSWYSDPSSPSRTNRRWTPLGYAQVSASLLY